MLRATYSPVNNSSSHAPSRSPLRVFGFGTVFVTQKLILNAYPEAGTVARAQNVRKTRGGHSANVLAILAQFRSSRPKTHIASSSSFRVVDDVQFCGPLSGAEEGALILKEFESQGVSTIFSVIREGKSVPTAWVIEVDMTHEEFVSRLGPVLAPENYDISPNTLPSHPVNVPPVPPNHLRKRSGSGPQIYSSSGGNNPTNFPYQQFILPGMPPFEWMHFEGRSPNILHFNLTGLDGLARERGWRSKCVFSLQISRTGVEALIQHANVIFFSKPYAQSTSPNASPRAFLISMCAHASPNALLVADWGSQGAALLSVPTREYFQSSGWVEPNIVKQSWNGGTSTEPGSIISGSGFWADGRTYSSQELDNSMSASAPLDKDNLRHSTISDMGSESSTTSTETEKGTQTFLDEVGAHDAFVAGMILALSQKILPGRPYTTEANGKTPDNISKTTGKWKLEECLRFATELAGRKGRKTGLQGLRTEMEKGGWAFE
ncbi:hypothetical protein Clacol_008368 [Clathrus columnatus]|uniref:Carbohydrate kinase PfkB domain-containing protein n=1 Tax=Clathrus columnatus TaxID=1419009 RepID=A0AAV5AMH6_9AGAM|nr:hypothetical protein Clacol_008368 [Clathrus columnatus]